jgi:adenylylsulfate kinase-like enzyme
VEVHVTAPAALREQRNAKGHYAKAQGADLATLTAPYEPPQNPELELHTDKMTVAEAVARILEYLHLGEEDAAISI